MHKRTRHAFNIKGITDDRYPGKLKGSILKIGLVINVRGFVMLNTKEGSLMKKS